MANEDLIYAYETNFITALETIISLPATQTRLFGDTATKQTPRIDVGFTYGGAGLIDRALTSEGKQYLRKHNGTINLTVNGTVKADHLALVGKVRNFMAWNVPTLINPVLEFYQVQSVFEQGGSNESGEEDGDFEISTELNFDVVFQIPPAAFDIFFTASGASIDPDISGLRFIDTGTTENGQPVYQTADTTIGTAPEFPHWRLFYPAFSDTWTVEALNSVGAPAQRWEGSGVVGEIAGDYEPAALFPNTGTLTLTSSDEL